jgi:hypothetical protein
MRLVFVLGVFVAGLACAPTARSQSTITNDPLELTGSVGLWAALLPAYELGSNNNGAQAFRDNMDDLGFTGQLKFVRRWLHTRTSFESKIFYAGADSTSTTGPIGVDIPNPSSGANNALAGSGTHLDSSTDHYGIDVALRDTWRTRFGGLSAGAAFSYMVFDQQFDSDYGATQLMREDLETDYLGGKAFAGWEGCLRGHPTNLDFAIGFFDMDGDYRFSGRTISGSLQRTLNKTAISFETLLTTQRTYRGYNVGTTFGLMYLSEMAKIEHNTGTAATLGSDDAVTLTALLDIRM